MMIDRTFLIELKQLIIDECDKADEFSVDDIGDDSLLFGPQSELDLDSLDALQISVALKDKYGVHIAGAKDVRKHLTTVSNIADYVNIHR